MFDFLGLDNESFVDLNQEQIEGFLSNAQMVQKSKEAMQKRLNSFNRIIEETKFYSKNGQVLLWIKLHNSEDFSKSDLISAVSIYNRIIKSDFILTELEYKGMKKYSACRKKNSDLEIGVNTNLYCGFSPWIYEKNNGSVINTLLKSIKDTFEGNEDLSNKNIKVLDAIEKSSEWADIPINVYKNDISKILEIRPELELFTVKKEDDYGIKDFFEPNTLFHVLLENKLVYKSENDWDVFIERISSNLQKGFTERDYVNFWRLKTGGNKETDYSDLLCDSQVDIKNRFQSLIDKENSKLYKDFYAVLGSTELCEGGTPEYTYEKVYSLLQKLREETNYDQNKLIIAERELSGSLLRKAIARIDNPYYFEMSEKLQEKDHEERCHYGIKTKNIVILEEELKYGIVKYFNSAIHELANIYVNLDKNLSFSYRAENLLKWIELMKLAEIHGDINYNETIEKVAYRGSKLYNLACSNKEINVYPKRIVSLIDSKFDDAPTTYSKYLEEIEKLEEEQHEIDRKKELQVKKIESIEKNNQEDIKISVKIEEIEKAFNELDKMSDFLKNNIRTEKYLDKEVDLLEEITNFIHNNLSQNIRLTYPEEKIKFTLNCIVEFCDGQYENARDDLDFIVLDKIKENIEHIRTILKR